MFNVIMTVTEKRNPAIFNDSTSSLYKSFDKESEAMDFVSKTIQSIYMHPANISSDTIKKILHPNEEYFNDDNEYYVEHCGSTNDCKWASIGYTNADRSTHWTITFTMVEKKPSVDDLGTIKCITDCGGRIPTKIAGSNDGYKIYAPFNFNVPPHGTSVIESRVAFDIPYQCIGNVCSSETYVKKGIIASGTLHHDSSKITKRLIVTLMNITDDSYEFNAGEEIAELYLLKVIAPEIVNIV